MRDIGPETVIDGRYQIVEHLGTGGMAEVFCATDLQLGRRVALKLLHDRFAQDEEFVERFRREASSAAGLQHQHVVSVYDRGEWNGTSYIAMEYVPGRTLKEVLLEEGPFEPQRAIEIAVQILSAARFAHRRGVIHRDLKPHNVILDEEGRAKVTDFGIAKAGASEMTMTGSIMGTAQYLSPEQAQGHAVSAQSDLYSVGIVLYELLTGRVPFEAESAVTIALKQVNEAPVPPSTLNPAVTPELENVVMRALEKDPARRFADADEFITALEHAGGAQPTSAYAPVDAGQTGVFAPVGVVEAEHEEEHPVQRRRRPRWPWIVALVVLAAIAAGGLALLLASGEDEKPVPGVVGSSISVATQRLRAEGFEVEYVRDTNDRPRNTVIGQDPPAGDLAEEGSTVTLNISEGPAITAVPDVQGEGRVAATRKLEAAGFEVREEQAFSDDVPRNRVIEQSPSGNSQAARGTTVVLTISQGAERVAVPGVVGQSEEDARSALEAEGFSVQTDEREDAEADPGTVLAQSPGEGERAPRGSAVTITLATESQRVVVPNVVGRSQNRATELLSGRGFEVDVEETEADSIGQDGIVQSQSPAGNGDRQADRGSSVTITVGRFDPELDPENERPPSEPDPDPEQPAP